MEKSEFRALFSLPNIIKEVTMGDRQHTLGDVRIYHGKKSLGKLRLTKNNNIKVDPKTEYDGVN
jgi:hypothetical protein